MRQRGAGPGADDGGREHRRQRHTQQASFREGERDLMALLRTDPSPRSLLDALRLGCLWSNLMLCVQHKSTLRCGYCYTFAYHSRVGRDALCARPRRTGYGAGPIGHGRWRQSSDPHGQDVRQRPGARPVARRSTGPRSTLRGDERPSEVDRPAAHVGPGGTPSTAERPESPVPLVQCKGIRKHFGGVKALDGVDFALRPGEVHALLGQNGAGKSTLIKILAGVQQPDSGQILIDGSAVRITDPNAARAMGIGVVYQELSLVPSMSIAANLFLGHEPHGRLGWVHRGEMNRAAERFFEEYGLPLRANTLVQDLPFAYQQLTEIAKALITDARILILDEPTSALSEDEERILFDAIHSVCRSGVGAIYVTHRLAEVFEVAQRVTVFRDGLRAASLKTAETDMPSLVAAIVGEEESPARMLAVSGLGPHGERPTSSDSISVSEDDATRARAAHFTVSVVLHTTKSDWARQQIEGITSTLGLYGGEVIETVTASTTSSRRSRSSSGPSRCILMPSSPSPSGAGRSPMPAGRSLKQESSLSSWTMRRAACAPTSTMRAWCPRTTTDSAALPPRCSRLTCPRQAASASSATARTSSSPTSGRRRSVAGWPSVARMSTCATSASSTSTDRECLEALLADDPDYRWALRRLG